MAVVDVRGVGVDNNDANDDDDALLLRVPLGDKTWSGSIAITTESEQKQKREDEERVFGMSEISVHRLGTKLLNPQQISFSKHYHKATNNIGRCSLL